MQNGGGGSLEDLRPIRKDTGLRDLLKLEQMPSSDAAGDFLRRSFSNGGLEGLGEVNRRILRRGLKHDGVKGYTLDIDATAIKAAKRLAHWTYKGFEGYMPIAGHLAENGLIVGDAVVYHAGACWLKVRRDMEELFSRIRYRSWLFAEG